MLKNILLAFIPVFVAVDAIGVLPLFVGLTTKLTPKEKISVITQSMVTASCLAIGFIFLGKAVFRLLGITVGDFMVAGGSILFCIAVIDIVQPNRDRHLPMKELGAVPLGTPLIVGPAVLTTSLIIINEYGFTASLISLLLNIIIAGGFLLLATRLVTFLGEAGSKALSKIASLLLAGIAVMMIRKGVILMLLK